MKAVITGASSGLGRDMARVLSKKGYDIIAVARREERLIELQKELETNVEIVCMDITDKENCIELSKRAGEVDIFINNAGFGVFGNFDETDLDSELKMIDTNIKSVHILTKLFAKEFKKKNSGKILNVASLASFFPGPLFASYYGTKSYVLRFSQSIQEELRQSGSKVKISVLCPGPVNTEFGDVAKVSFGSGEEKGKSFIVLESMDVAKYAIKKFLSGKEVIIPGFLMKAAVFMRHILSDKLLAKAAYVLQSSKVVKK